MICVKMHKGSDGRSVLAACDEEVLGGSYSEGKLRLKVHESFYREEVVSELVLIRMMEEADIMNLVGEATISLAIGEGYVDESNVITIGGVVHAQVVKG
ncbi:MAG: DUF424 family protein [Candidatus Methanomethylophilaceae archaeon]|jgi:hypothetical protein|nr:DUF424 family protein [Candidatus Methanomethylophilaceae archaeon]